MDHRDDSAASAAGGRKRQKVLAACDLCRNRKIKCDGIRPACSPCKKRYGTTAACSWGSGSARVNQHAPLQYVRQLEARIYELEHNNSPQTNAPNQSSGQPQITQYPRGPAFSELREPLQGDYLASASHPSSVAGHVESSALWQSVRREPEVLPAVIGAATNESRAQERYGSSSAGSFMQHVREVVEKRTNSPSTGQSQIRVPDADEQPLMVPKEDSDQKHHDWALPTRKRADDLMTTYWDVVHPLYPFLGKRMTTADYENLWTGAALIPHERSYLCLLNLLFAMSSQLTESVPPRDRESASNVFYERARGLLELRDSACIRYVQIYLLFALYLQSTNAGHECWIFTGLAIRTAQTLELHKPETNERPSNARIRSLLRRVWYACVLLDRVLSMTYGRPCMISRRVALSVPQCVPVEGEERYLEADLSLALYPSEKPAMVDFFNQSLALYDILYDILTNFYASEPPLAQTLDEVYQYFFEGARGFSHEATVLQIEGKLASWKKALPSHLRMSSHSERNRPVTMLSRQATILHQRFLHVRLLALRPVLSAFLIHDSPEPEAHLSSEMPLSRQIILQCSVMCVMTAQEAIDLVDQRRLTTNPGAMANLAAWWYNVLFLYTSATVLIAARLSPLILSQITETAIFDSWRKVLHGFDQYSVFGTPIRRLRNTLKLLFDTVPQQFSQIRQLPEERDRRRRISGPRHTTEAWTQGEAEESRQPAMSQPQGAPALDQDRLSTDSFDFTWDGSPSLFAAFDTNDMSWLTTVPFEI